MSIRKIYMNTGAAIATAMVTIPLPAFAQNDDGLTDIVVTAQKRQENLQDVPVAISAITSQALESSGISSAMDLSQATPGLVVSQASSLFQPFLRGVGNSATLNGNESSTAVYIDGVYYARLPSTFFEFNDIDRIEVLKGPQGTLYGRNASGGLIHLITRDPKQTPEMKFGLTYGNYNTIVADMFAGGALTDNVRASISAHYKKHDGWGERALDGGDAWFEKGGGVRGKLIADLGDRTEVKVAADYIWTKSDFGASSIPYRGTTIYTVRPPRTVLRPLPDFYDIQHDLHNFRVDKGWGASVRISHDLDFAEFVSLSAYRKDTGNFANDADATPQFTNHAFIRYFTEQKSQEFQLVSAPSDVFDWILGLYYINIKAGFNPANLEAVSTAGVASSTFIYGRQVVNSYAGFGQGTYHVTPTTDLTVGLRYTIDDVQARGETRLTRPVALVFPSNPDDVQFKKLTYRLAVNQHLNDDAMIYASLSRGYKSGVFGTLPVSASPTKPEVLDAYELGFKSELFDKRLRLNGALFWYDIKNLQVQIYNGVATLLDNADSARIKGFELEANAAPMAGLELRAGVAYTHARYRSFHDAPYVLPNTLPGQGGNLPTPLQLDVSGFDMIRAPEWTVNLGGSYSVPLGGATATLDANYSYNSGFYWQPDNRLRQGAYNIVNAGLTIAPAKMPLRVRVWGKNLTDVQYYTNVSANSGPSGDTATPAAPRTYGVTLSADF